jgi:hypothetical protein
MKKLILLSALVFFIGVIGLVSAVECNIDKDCWDNHNKSCYYVCEENKCLEIKTLAALPPYPYCHCAIMSCAYADWVNNSDSCKGKCCELVKCPYAFLNESTLECQCGEIPEKLTFFQKIINWFRNLFKG